MQYIGADDLSPVRPTRITCLFVIGDLISFILQGAGGSMEASDDANMTTANHIILLGLGIQLIFFFFFIFLTFVFHSRTRDWDVKANEGDWKRLLHVLEASSVLIFIRSIYRIIQFAQGFDGYLISHEVFLYLFDSLLMLILLFSFVHPGTVFEEQEPENKDIEMGLI